MSFTSLLNVGFIILLVTGCATSSNHPLKMSDKEKAQAFLEVASSSISDGDSTGALISLKQAEDLDSQNPELHYLFALAYFQKTEIDLAVKSARKAVELKPDFSIAKNTLGKLLMDEGKLNEAEKYLTEAAHDLLSRDAYIAKTNLGILNYKKMKPNQALYWLSSALKDGGPVACVAAYYRGKIYLDQGQFELAKADFNTSTKNACASMSESHLALGQTLIRMKKYDLARAKLLEIKQLFPASESAISADRYLREIP